MKPLLDFVKRFIIQSIKQNIKKKMTEPNCTVKKYSLTKQGRREIEAIFNGGEITSDSGVLLLREIDRQLGLTLEAAKALKDPRNRKRIIHTQLSQLRQRVYALALGYEDLNDHHSLRQDTALQTALARRVHKQSVMHLIGNKNGV
jgi:hypothetical protein